MSRLEQIERQEVALKEEKKLAKIEDGFAAKKAAGTLTRAGKNNLRKKRQAYRENHRKPVSEGASPEAIDAPAKPGRVD